MQICMSLEVETGSSSTRKGRYSIAQLHIRVQRHSIVRNMRFMKEWKPTETKNGGGKITIFGITNAINAAIKPIITWFDFLLVSNVFNLFAVWKYLDIFHKHIRVHIYMYVHTYTNTCIYTYTYMYIYIYTYIYMYVHTYVCISKSAFIYIYIYIYIYVYVSRYKDTYMYIYITYIHMYAYVNKNTYIYIHICVHICIHIW